MSERLGLYLGFAMFVKSKVPEPITFDQTIDVGVWFVIVDCNWICEVVSQTLNCGAPTIVITGSGWTVIVTWFVFLHPVAVTVSSTEYVVVTTGFTVGLELFDVKPVGLLLHE